MYAAKPKLDSKHDRNLHFDWVQACDADHRNWRHDRTEMRRNVSRFPTNFQKIASE
jgi:hypothetical protein